MTWKKSTSGSVVLWAFFIGLCVTEVPVRAEPAILVSSHRTMEILRYDGETGEFVGVHVPRGRMLNNTGMSISGNELYVACENTDSILRFNLQTGEFIDVFVKPQSGGLWRPAHFSINTGEIPAFGRAAASARAADGNHYVTSKDRDAVLRFGGTALLQMAASGRVAGALLCEPGKPCPGPRANENNPDDPEFDIYGQPVADFIPGDPSRTHVPLKPAWDVNGDMHVSFNDRTCGVEGWLGAAMRFEPDTGNAKPSSCAGVVDEYVSCDSGGLNEPSYGALGPDGNLYVGSGPFVPDCQVEDAVMRFAGPLPPGVNPGEPGDTRGDCFGRIEGCPCPNLNPEVETVSRGGFVPGCMVTNVYFGPHGNIYVVLLLGDAILRYAGPLPHGVNPGDPGDLRGDCAVPLMKPGDPCPGLLADLATDPDSAEFIPYTPATGGYGGLHIPYDIAFVDLPPAEACVPPANDECATAMILDNTQDVQSVKFDNRCASLDGTAELTCEYPEPGALDGDLWYQYVAPRDGRLTVSTCESIPGPAGALYFPPDPVVNHRAALDTLLAVYGGGPSCECPTDNTSLLSCNDDHCYGAYTAGPSRVSVPVQEGMCYTIRLASVPNDSSKELGAASLKLELSEDCPPPALSPAAEVAVATNRFISFSYRSLPILTRNHGSSDMRAIRVKFVDLPGAYASLNGTTMWVGPRHDACENSGQASAQGWCGGNRGCLDGRVGALCHQDSDCCELGVDGEPASFQRAELTCAPYYRHDWQIPETIHVYDEYIVPGGVYEFQAIQLGCPTDEEARYSTPAGQPTSIWGDVAGPFVDGAWSEPDGRVDVIIDVVAILDKFRNLDDALGKTSADLVGIAPNPALPDLKITLSDVFYGLDAFRGEEFPFEPPGPPCQ